MLELVPFAIVLFAISAWRFQGKGIWNLARAVMIAPIEKQISAQLARKISALQRRLAWCPHYAGTDFDNVGGARCIIFTR